MNAIANAHEMFDLPVIEWAAGSLREETPGSAPCRVIVSSAPLPAVVETRAPEPIEHKRATRPRPSEKRMTIHGARKCTNPEGHRWHKHGKHPGGTLRLQCYWCPASACEAR